MMKSFFGSFGRWVLFAVAAAILAFRLPSGCLAQTPQIGQTSQTMFGGGTDNGFYRIDLITNPGATNLIGTVYATSPVGAPQPRRLISMIFLSGTTPGNILALDSNGRMFQFSSTDPGHATYLYDSGIVTSDLNVPEAIVKGTGFNGNPYYAIAIGNHGAAQYGTYECGLSLTGRDSSWISLLTEYYQQAIVNVNGNLYANDSAGRWFDDTSGTASIKSTSSEAWISLTVDSTTGWTIWGLYNPYVGRSISRANASDGSAIVVSSVTLTGPGANTIVSICSSTN